MTFPYRAVFAQAEATLLSYGSRRFALAESAAALAPFRAMPQRFTDEELFWTLVFYSGFRAATVTDRLVTIRPHFADWHPVTAHREEDVRRIVDDPGMIRPERKIRGLVKNALAVQAIVVQHGSVQAYNEGFRRNESFEQAETDGT